MKALLLDLYEPTGQTVPGSPRPAILIIHGGGFVGGSRQFPAWVDLATELAKRGYVVASIDYRLAGDDPVLSERVQALPLTTGFEFERWMIAAVDDGLTALDWLVDNTGTLYLDPTRLGVMGGSAGATTAIHLAYTVSDYGIDSPALKIAVDLWGSAMIPLDDPEAAVNHLETGEPPIFIVHGTEDGTVPISRSYALAARADEQGVPYEFHLIDGAAHGFDYIDLLVDEVEPGLSVFDRMVEWIHAALFQDFTINAGHSGAWFNPATSGQGQLIDIEPETQFMFLAWFTFTDAASDNPFEQQWYTAQGNYSGDTAVLDLYETLGGIFDDPREVTTTRVGEVSLRFSDCNQGQMTYSIDGKGLQGEFPLNRAIPGSGNVCEGLSGSTTQAVDINAGMDGAWYDPITPGQGFLIDAHPNPAGGNFIFVAWFTYGADTASGQRWLTAQGSFEGSIAEIDVFESNGGSFDDPLAPGTTKVGTLNVDFTDCSNAQLSYSLPADPAEGDIAVTRVIPGGQALCEELVGAD